MKNYFLLFTFLLSITIPGVAQNLKEIARQQDSIYQENIKKSRLFGVYIPKDIDDAFEELNRLADETSRAKFISIPESEAAKKLYYGIGRWMSYNWNFVEGSRFSKNLNDLGLLYEDDMIDFMLRSYHRYLSGSDLASESLVKKYVDRRKNEKESKKVVMDSWTVQRDSTYIPK